jgi:hypothetical protein
VVVAQPKVVVAQPQVLDLRQLRVEHLAVARGAAAVASRLALRLSDA